MQADLPWNVAGIPPEAREAARAAARREGLSVGEWLTRRILRSFGDLGEQFASRESWRNHAPASNGYAPPEETPVNTLTARDSQDMLDRVSRSETETQGAYRRIEDQLKGVGRRLEAAERSQTENNRAMSKAATEINVAAREQAQAFDQLGTHIVTLNERLQRVERSTANDGLRDAVKALHQGMSRLADQLADTANQSATQLASLAGNVESVVGQVSEGRAETEHMARAIDDRIAVMDERVRAVERAAYATATTLERTVQSLEQSEAAKHNEENEFHRQAAAITQLSETLDRLGSRFSASEAELERQGSRFSSSQAETAGAMARLEENVAKLEHRGADPAIDRRLTGIENALSDISGRMETSERRNAGAQVEEDFRELVLRVDAADKRHRDALTELRAAVKEASNHLEPERPLERPPEQPIVAPPVAPVAPPPFDLPPFAEHNPQPVFHQADAPAAAAGVPPPPPPVFDSAELFSEQPADIADPFAADAVSPAGAAGQESFLAAARRSARSAAAAETDQTPRGPVGGFSWGFARGAATPADAAGSTRFVLITGIALLVVIAVAAGIMLSRNTNTPRQQPALSALLAPNPAPPPATTTATPTAPSIATAPSSATGNQASTSAPQAAEPDTTARYTPPSSPVVRKSRTSTAPVSVVKAPPVHAPAPQAATPSQHAATLSPMQRLAALANSGSVQGELLLGMAYLDGQGTTVNEAEAARWLERAANQGNAIAAYRLGTLYERGHGVPANAAKSVQLYMTAAKAGNRKAMHNVAVAYAQGVGIARDYGKAAQWFTRAADLGLADSQFNLAVLYERGMGVPQSLKDAYKWYAIAAAQGDKESKNRIDVLSSQISPDDKTAAQAAAQAFHPRTMDRAANVPPDASAVLGG
jgi:localization factor PodJL